MQFKPNKATLVGPMAQGQGSRPPTRVWVARSIPWLALRSTKTVRVTFCLLIDVLVASILHSRRLRHKVTKWKLIVRR
jgi:hypothetical protein